MSSSSPYFLAVYSPLLREISACNAFEARATALSEERFSANNIAIWTRLSACSEVIS